MEKLSQIELSNLDLVTATIVHEMGQIGLFHYNKLTYLFEYFFIKNFGCRYTKERFIKYPHGPVIPNYQKQITNLIINNVIAGDINKISQRRKVDTDYYEKTIIKSLPQTSNFIIPNKGIYFLLKQIISTYGNLSVEDLEKVVYKTEPIKKFLSNPFKKKTGGYVLTSDCIKIRDFNTDKAKGLRLALKHLEKYPKNHNDYKELEKEYNYFSKMCASL